MVNEERLWGISETASHFTVYEVAPDRPRHTPPKSLAFGLRWFDSSSYNQALSYSWSSIPDSHSGDVEFESPKSCHLKGTSSNMIVVHHLGQLAQLAER